MRVIMEVSVFLCGYSYGCCYYYSYYDEYNINSNNPVIVIIIINVLISINDFQSYL